MINLSLVARMLNRPGSIVDMIAQDAIVESVKVVRNKLIIRVTPVRNLDKGYSPDEYIWGQNEAKFYRVNEWRIK